MNCTENSRRKRLFRKVTILSTDAKRRLHICAIRYSRLSTQFRIGGPSIFGEPPMLKSQLTSLIWNSWAVSILALAVCFQPAFAIITTTSSSALPNNASPANETDRNSTSSFLQAIPNSSSFDFTGVGQASDCANASGSIGIGICWATMISPTLFLSATHSHPRDDAIINFYDDDGNAITAGHTVSNMSSLSGPILNSLGTNSDLWIGELTTPVPSGVAQYNIAAPALGAITVQAGTTGSTTIVPQFRVGQNRLDGTILAANFDPGAVNRSDFLLYVDNSVQGAVDPANTILTPDLEYETGFQGGDSGGPSFISNGGTLELVGIHSFITNLGVFTTEFDANGDPIPMSGGTAVRQGSADVRVASHISTINERVAAAVPEPSAALFVLLAGILGGLRTYWRRFAATC